MPENTPSHPHSGHRERMKSRFIQDGLENFQPHEVLEMLLFYSIPRRDTNELAHSLIEHFGSLNGVFNADYNELVRVDGIKDSSATLIRFFSELMRRVAIEGYEEPKRFGKFADIAKYLINLYVNVNVERVYLLLFDNSLRLIDRICLGDGTVNESNVIIRTIAEHALNHKAASVLLAHNHPGGIAVPSKSDLEYTLSLNNALGLLNITLIDHVIVAGNSVASIMNNMLGMARMSPIDGKIDESFYVEYYRKPEEVMKDHESKRK